MKIHTLVRRQAVPVPLDRVYPFFEDAHNLARMTPPEMGFAILTPGPIEMREGALIDYVVRIGPLPMRWTTLITRYDAPRAFVDVQLKGPYSYWHHHHEFTPFDGGTEIADTIHYAIPFGPLGTVAHALFVRRQLERIFDYRMAFIKDIFDGKRKDTHK
jgi:ligand-binding SRPBCC domain-containing protein